MADLIRREDAIRALVSVPDIKGPGYRLLLEKLQHIPSIDKERCYGCFGASFGDCEECQERDHR